jgi:glucose-1-phosphate cytidylyltransferase
MLYRHRGFWRSMDTFKDALELNETWDSGQAPWKTW